MLKGEKEPASEDEGTSMPERGNGLCKVQIVVLSLTCSVTFVTLLNTLLCVRFLDSVDNKSIAVAVRVK